MNKKTELILNNLFLAEKIAKSRKKKLSHISYEEFKSAAYLGLVEAANSYDPQKNNCFEAYAIWRIIGSIRDYLRELSWGSRSNRLKKHDILDEFYTSDEFQDISFEEIISNLPSMNKKILKLYYQDGCKIKDIAEDIGVHESRISQILTDSKSRLQNIWKDDLCSNAA